MKRMGVEPEAKRYTTCEVTGSHVLHIRALLKASDVESGNMGRLTFCGHPAEKDIRVIPLDDLALVTDDWRYCEKCLAHAHTLLLEGVTS